MSTNIISSNDNQIEIHDFDVLADELPGTVFDMEAYNRQIGNNRFDVMIQMYQEGFNKYYAKNKMAECDDIVEKIVSVTCHKTSTALHKQGRFLVKPMYGTDGWRELDDEESKQFVMQALRAPAVEEEDLGQELEDEFAPLPVTSQVDLTMLDIPSIDFRNMGLNDKKRGRRQSLLRRSASESTTLMDKKKGLKNLDGELYRGGTDGIPTLPTPTHAALRRYNSGTLPETAPLKGMLQRHNTVSNLLPTRSLPNTATATTHVYEQNKTISEAGTIAHTIQGMDVVLADDCKSLSPKPNIVGNNRLKVMLILEERRFQTLSPEAQTDAACSLVKAVTVYWKGRILADKGFAYSILNHDESIDAMKNLLYAAPAISSLRDGSRSAVPSVISSTTIPSSSRLLAAAPQLPEFLLNASREILESGKGPEVLAGPERMQSAAVRSIKERAASRQIAKAGGTKNSSTSSRINNKSNKNNSGGASEVKMKRLQPSAAEHEDKGQGEVTKDEQ